MAANGLLLIVLSFFYSSTLTYIELEHAQSKQHVALLGVVDRMADQKAAFATPVADVSWKETKTRQFFSDFDM